MPGTAVGGRSRVEAHPPAPGGGVQVGVPQGRGRAPGAAADVRPGRRPVRRRAQPTARCCSAARRPRKRACGCPAAAAARRRRGDAVVPFQPWAKALLANRRTTSSSRTRGASRQGFVAPVPDAVRRRVRRSSRDPADLHLRHRRTAHVPHDLHGRPHAPGEPAAELLRPLHRLVGRRHAGRRHRRLQRRFWLDRRGCRTPRSCTRSNASPAPTRPRSSTR